MPLGKTIRIYLANGSVAGIRHGEIINWTGQALACPRSCFGDLKDFSESKRPGVYFLFGQDEESGQESVYIGEAEIVFDRLCSHINGKDFWTELVAFTSKDDNITKGHVRYLESRLVEIANAAGRYRIQNGTSPQLPALPRADRDAMEEFIDGIRTLLGVMGHRVLDPLIARQSETCTQLPAPVMPSSGNTLLSLPAQSAPNAQRFQLRVSNLKAEAVRTDEGLVVLAGSDAATEGQPSLSGGYRAQREQLLSSGILVENGSKLKFARDQLFRSPSQAGAVVVGYSINGRDAWKTPEGLTFTDFENRFTSRTPDIPNRIGNERRQKIDSDALLREIEQI